MIFGIFNLHFRLQLESDFVRIKGIIAATQWYLIYFAIVLNRTIDHSIHFISVDIESNHLILSSMNDETKQKESNRTKRFILLQS